MKRFKDFLKEDPDGFKFTKEDGKETADAFSSGRAFAFFGKDFYLLSYGQVHAEIEVVDKDMDKNVLLRKAELFIKNIEYNKKNSKSYVIDSWELKRIKLFFNEYKNVNPKKPNEEKEYKQSLVSYINQVGRAGFELHGRIWPEKKVISFWIYPKNLKEVNKVVKALSSKGVKIDKDWYVDFSGNESQEGLSFNKYKSSKELKSVKHDLSKIHMMPPSQKKKFLSKVRGFGSDLLAKRAKEYGYDTAAEWKFRTTMECIKLGDFIKLL